LRAGRLLALRSAGLPRGVVDSSAAGLAEVGGGLQEERALSSTEKCSSEGLKLGKVSGLRMAVKGRCVTRS
jgi:hypothetical protein